MLLELLPLLRLRRQNEIQDVLRDQTEGAIIVLGSTPAIEDRRLIAADAGLAINPEDRARGNAELVLGRYEQAISDVEQAMRLGGQSFKPIYSHGYCAGNSVSGASFITGGGFHFPVRASLCGA
jgi:hypothetical protein